MGEYAQRKDNRERVKIGTCEDMLYLRWEDRCKVDPVNGSTDPMLQPEGLRFRLPFPDEDGAGPGSGEPFRRWLLPGFAPDEAPDPGSVQLHHAASGLLLSVPCYHGERLPEVGPGISVHWNGRPVHFWSLMSVRCAGGILWPVVGCCACSRMIRSTWSAVLPHVEDEAMRDRLITYGGEVAQP